MEESLAFFLGLVITGKQSQCFAFTSFEGFACFWVRERVKCLVLCSLAYFSNWDSRMGRVCLIYWTL